MRARICANRMAVQILIVAAVIVFANLLSLRVFGRVDLTQNKAYSITDSTKRTLRGLEDVVNVKVYFSKKLPPYLTTLTRAVRDELGEYQAYAGGKLVLDIKDPADDPAVEARVKALGIPQLQLNVITKDRAEVMPGYLGIAVLYGDKVEIIPVVENPGNLEYDLTSAILKVTSKEQKTVGFLKGHGEPEMTTGFESVTTVLAKEYSVVPVETPRGKPIPPYITTLIVAGPLYTNGWDRFAIDQYIMKGGKVLFAINKVLVTETSLEASRVKPGVDSLLASYGAQINTDMVVDRYCGTATFSAGAFSFSVPYPLWPLVGPNGFDQTSPVTNRLQQVVFPWTSSISLTSGSPKVDAVVLAKSSPQSWLETRNMTLNPQRSFAVPKGETAASHDLAVLLRGRFASFFADRPIPSADTTAASEVSPVTEKIAESPETQMIVVGDSRFFEEGFIHQFSDNETFFLNAVDWLTLGESMIGIRSKVVSTRPLKEIGEKSKASIRLASTLGVPIAVIAFGFVRRLLRGKRRRSDDAGIAGSTRGRGDGSAAGGNMVGGSAAGGSAREGNAAEGRVEE